MSYLASLVFAVLVGSPSAIKDFRVPDFPKACGKFPKLVPYGVWLQVDDRGRILWTGNENAWSPIEAKDLGKALKQRKADAEKKSNFIIGFAGIDKDGARKRFLAETLQRSGLAFSPEECLLITF